MPDLTANKLITGCIFVVKIPDIDTIGYFMSCRGLKLGVKVYEYQEGGNNGIVHRLPGPMTYPNLLLERGLTNESALLQWFMATQVEAQRKQLTITLHGGEVDRTWTFADAFPVEWNGPDITSGAEGVVTESLEIAHGGMQPS
jgi:phage tail-like protein